MPKNFIRFCDFVTEICVHIGYNILTNKERTDLTMSVLNVTKDNFEEIKSSEKVVLLDFYADWCGPCRMVSPIVDQIASEHPEYLVGKVNVDNEPELAQAFGVSSIPMLAVLKDGNIINKSVGARPKAQILAMLES